jgi:hypothetical protein
MAMTVTMMMLMVRDYVSKLRPPTGLFIPKWYMTIENHGRMISIGETLDLCTKALWQFYQQLTSSKAGGTGEENYEFGFTSYLCSYFEGFFNMSQITHVVDDITFPQTNACCGILSSLKIHRPRPGLIPRTLTPMANTLTITARRTITLITIG